MANTCGRPTAQEWLEKKAEIERLYLKNNMPLSEMKNHFDRQGFRATSRQYKTRFKSWGFDTKKIRRHIWHAMYAHIVSLPNDGLSPVFRVPVRGGDTVWIQPDRIIKELKRSDPYVDFDGAGQADRILERAGIEKFLINADMTEHSPPDSSQSLVSPAGKVQGHSAAMNTFGRNRDWSPSTSDEGQIDDLAMSICTPRTCSLPSYTHANPPPVYCQGFDTSACSEQVDDGLIMEFVLDPACRALACEDWNAVKGHKRTETALDMVPFQLSLSNASFGSTDQEARLAAQWIAPYLMASLTQRKTSKVKLRFDRQNAQQAFRAMLRTNNRFVFPVCNAVLTILAASGHNLLVVEFLRDVCNIIDRDASDHSMTYGSPFRLALDMYTGDDDDLKLRSHEFTTSSDLICLIWGRETSNFLVSRHHHAWHYLNLKDYKTAIEIFSQCLPISERIMGPRHLITVNCLAMWSRALAEIGCTRDAVSMLRDAIDRLTHVTNLLQVYRCRLLFRLAELEIAIGNVLDAEHNLRAVLQFRLEYFGVQHGQAWSVSDKLIELLTSQGRHEESNSLSELMSARYLEAEESDRNADQGLESLFVPSLQAVVRKIKFQDHRPI